MALAAALGCLASATVACSPTGALSLQPAVDVGASTSAIVPLQAPLSVPVQASMQAMSPRAPFGAGYPRLDQPQTLPDAMSADEAACRQELKRLDVTYRDLPAIEDGGACGIDRPVSISDINGVAIKPAATLTCDMAATFARWTRKELVPSSRTRYFTGIKAIHQASSYSCRRIAGSGSMSQHASGNAIDISRIELNNGRDIDVRKPGLFAFRQRGFLNNVRGDGCSYFTTVLGPGYNYAHRDHFHFDIQPRKNGYVACR